jgi:hypothetical protein
LKRQVIRAIANKQKQRKYPDEVHAEPREPIPLKISVRFLIDSVLKYEQEQGINVIDWLELWKKDADSVEEPYWSYKPRDILVNNEWR